MPAAFLREVMDEDELAAFRDAEDETVEESAAAEQRDLLVFELDGVLFGVPAERVSTVVAWRTPTPVPQGGPALAGVIQDSGRIIVVLHHPTGRPEAPSGEAARVVVAETRRGHIGLPASRTRGVERLAASATTSLGEVLESHGAAVTFVEPEQVLDVVLGG